MNCYFIAIIIVIVIIAIVVYGTKCIPNKQLSEYMDGYWVADKEYLDQTDYNHIGLYLKNGDENIGQLVVSYNDDTYLINGPIEYEYHVKNSSAVWLSLDKEYELSVELSGASPFIPDDKNITMKISPYDGSMTIYEDLTVYAILYKDNIASSAAKLVGDDDKK